MSLIGVGLITKCAVVDSAAGSKQPKNIKNSSE